MILYSIVPPEIVFANSDNYTANGYIEMEYQGEKLLVSPAGENKYMISRLISTSPKAYLNPGFQPGTIINLSLNMETKKTPV